VCSTMRICCEFKRWNARPVSVCDATPALIDETDENADQ
jgi:hypothetical protein